MKVSSIYSNKEEVFPRIDFYSGFNVVFAQVKNPKIREEDSHNLGKTFLIRVLDFGLLCKVDTEHPFKKHPELFSELIFFLEIETNDGEFITVKRPVSGQKGIAIHVSDEGKNNFIDLPKSSWLYSSLSVDKGRETLNDLINLKAIKPFFYRKGLGYFLRSQSDYDEIFRISKFQYGSHKDWKPFVALLLGFDQELISKKYELDDNKVDLEKRLQIIEEEAKAKSDEYDNVRGLLQIRKNEAERMRRDVDSFSFRNIEAEINETTVYKIERQIATLNERRYTVDYEIQEIDKTLFEDDRLEFDVKKIQEIFREAQVVFPENLTKNYEELIEFNKKISSGRAERLTRLKQKLLLDKIEIVKQIDLLDERRSSALRLLQEKRTLEKYKQIQILLQDKKREIVELEHRLSQLDKAGTVQQEIEQKQQEITNAATEIRTITRAENETYTQVRKNFTSLVEEVINVPALLSVTPNQAGNLDFHVQTLDPKIYGRETSEALGTSYKKILAACFDLSLLVTYANQDFYRFVYHDGIFEGLDNRRKVALLNLIRRICVEKKIQYILTVIDSDLPRDEIDNKLMFSSEEIIRFLHDQGDDGRLFKMQRF